MLWVCFHTAESGPRGPALGLQKTGGERKRVIGGGSGPCVIQRFRFSGGGMPGLHPLQKFLFRKGGGRSPARMGGGRTSRCPSVGYRILYQTGHRFFR